MFLLPEFEFPEVDQSYDEFADYISLFRNKYNLINKLNIIIEE